MKNYHNFYDFLLVFSLSDIINATKSFKTFVTNRKVDKCCSMRNLLLLFKTACTYFKKYCFILFVFISDILIIKQKS